MKRILSICALCALVLIGWSTPSEATPPEPNPGVCPEGGAWSAHLSANDQTFFTFEAPDGFLISEYCVKAGSLNQGYGPEIFTVDPPAASIAFGHSSGKEISHFSVILVDDGEEEPPPETVPTTTPTTEAPTPTTEAPATTSVPVIDTPLVIEAPVVAGAVVTAEPPELAFTGISLARALFALAVLVVGIALCVYAYVLAGGRDG